MSKEAREAIHLTEGSEYVRALIREDQRRKEEARLEALILEGLASGPANEMIGEDWEELRRRARERWAQKISNP